MKLWVIVVAIIAASAGFGAALFVQSGLDSKFSVPFDDHADKADIKAGRSLGCRAIADALLLEKRVGERTVEATGKGGTDTASIKISEDGRTIVMLTGASLRAGATQGNAMPIIDRTPSFIVAQNNAWPSFETVVLDVRSGNAVWTIAGYIFGMGTETIYLQCD